MKRIALTAALVSALAAPALAQSPLELLVANYNQSQDSVSERISIGGGATGVTLSTKGGAFAGLVDRYNADQERVSDRIGGSVTVFSGGPAYAADVFAALAAEDDSN